MRQERADQLRLIKILREERKRQCERSYYEFVKDAWDVLEPETPFVDNWHIKFLCDIIQVLIVRVASRLPKIRDLIVNLPPRSMKSYIFSIFLTPWAWTQWPHLKFMGSSYDENLAKDLNLKARRLIESSWYQERWGHVFQLTTDQNEKRFFENNQRGHRVAVSVEGGIAGWGCDIAISDDDLDVKQARSGLKRQRCQDHYRTGLSRRINDKEIGLRIIVQQRLHEDDLTGSELKAAKEDYDHICIPAEENDTVSPPAIRGFYQDGLFFPARFSKSILDKMRKGNSRDFAGQFNQKPGSEGGDAFPRGCWKSYRTHPENFDKLVISWDMSFKKTEKASFTVGQVWGRRGPNAYLLDQWRKQCSFNEAKKAVIAMALKWPLVRAKLIENKANGPAIIDSLKSSIEGIIEIEPEGSKVERAEAHAALAEAGCLWVPDQNMQPWVLDFIDEFAIFDEKLFFDQIDAASQAWDYLFGKDDVAERLERLLKM